LKKPAGSVRFWFYKQKTEPNRNRKKPSQNRAKLENRANRFEPVFSLKNRTEPKPVGLTRFRFFLKKISIWLLFLIKTEPNRKWSPLESITNQEVQGSIIQHQMMKLKKKILKKTLKKSNLNRVRRQNWWIGLWDWIT